MAAAANGAQFPMAQKLRNTMTLGQLHDFATGSEANKPQYVANPAPPVRVAPIPAMPVPAMHPVMVERANMVKQAHAHLAQAIPGFGQLPARQRMLAVQEHVRTRKANGY